MTDLTTTVRVLENNLNPATHFIEVWKSDGVITQDKEALSYKKYQPFSSADFQYLTIIAIFKIRMKPQ